LFVFDLGQNGLSKSVKNGLRIGDGGAFEKRQPNICTNA